MDDAGAGGGKRLGPVGRGERLLLRIQAAHARAAGRTEVASRLELAIAGLTAPPGAA